MRTAIRQMSILAVMAVIGYAQSPNVPATPRTTVADTLLDLSGQAFVGRVSMVLQHPVYTFSQAATITSGTFSASLYPGTYTVTIHSTTFNLDRVETWTVANSGTTQTLTNVGSPSAGIASAVTKDASGNVSIGTTLRAAIVVAGTDTGFATNQTLRSSAGARLESNGVGTETVIHGDAGSQILKIHDTRTALGQATAYIKNDGGGGSWLFQRTQSDHVTLCSSGIVGSMGAVAGDAVATDDFGIQSYTPTAGCLGTGAIQFLPLGVTKWSILGDGTGTLDGASGAQIHILGSAADWPTMPAIQLAETNNSSLSRKWAIINGTPAYGDLIFRVSASRSGDPFANGTTALALHRDQSATFAGTVAVSGGTSILYRCTVAGTLRVGQTTTVSADCGTAVDTGLRVN